MADTPLPPPPSENEPLVPWRQTESPDPAEAATAALVKEIGPAATLPAEAQARIARRAREAGGAPARGRWTGRTVGGLAGLAAAAAVFLVVKPYRAAPTPLGRIVLADPASTPTLAAPVAPRLERAEEVEKNARGAATPVPTANRERFAGQAAKAAGPGALSPRRLAKAAPALDHDEAEFARSDGPASAAPVIASRSRGPAARETAAEPASAAVGTLSEAERLTQLARYAEAVPLFTRVLAADPSADAQERALYGRARCRLALGQSDAGQVDVQRYLTRFPSGRFAGQARALAH